MSADPALALAGDPVCPFCNYTGPSEIVHEWPDVVAFAPLNPVVEGHLLVVPKRHVEHFGTDTRLSGRVADCAAQLVQSYLRPCNVITSVGYQATQTVKHLHLHIIPRRTGDGLALPWTTASDQLTEVRRLEREVALAHEELDSLDVQRTSFAGPFGAIKYEARVINLAGRIKCLGARKA